MSCSLIVQMSRQSSQRADGSWWKPFRFDLKFLGGRSAWNIPYANLHQYAADQPSEDRSVQKHPVRQLSQWSSSNPLFDHTLASQTYCSHCSWLFRFYFSTTLFIFHLCNGTDGPRANFVLSTVLKLGGCKRTDRSQCDAFVKSACGRLAC